MLLEPDLPESVAVDLRRHADQLAPLDQARQVAGRTPQLDNGLDAVGAGSAKGLQRAMTAYALWRAATNTDEAIYDTHPVALALDQLSRVSAPWTGPETTWLLDTSMRASQERNHWTLSQRTLIGVAAAEQLSVAELSAVRPALGRLVEQLRVPEYGDVDQESARLLRRVARLLSRDDPSSIPVDVLRPDDAFGARARAALLRDHSETAVAEVVAALAEYGTAITPSAAWSRTNAERRAVEPATQIVARRLLETVRDHTDTTPAPTPGGDLYPLQVFLRTSDTPVLRGAVWTVADLDQAWVVPLLADVGIQCGVGVGGHGGDSRRPGWPAR